MKLHLLPRHLALRCESRKNIKAVARSHLLFFQPPKSEHDWRQPLSARLSFTSRSTLFERVPFQFRPNQPSASCFKSLRQTSLTASHAAGNAKELAATLRPLASPPSQSLPLGFWFTAESTRSYTPKSFVCGHQGVTALLSLLPAKLGITTLHPIFLLLHSTFFNKEPA